MTGERIIMKVVKHEEEQGHVAFFWGGDPWEDRLRAARVLGLVVVVIEGGTFFCMTPAFARGRVGFVRKAAAALRFYLVVRERGDGGAALQHARTRLRAMCRALAAEEKRRGVFLRWDTKNAECDCDGEHDARISACIASWIV